MIRRMTVIKINAITVPPDSGDELARRFAARAGAVDNQDGFEGFELLKPTDERTTWLVVTRWRDEDAFQAQMIIAQSQPGGGVDVAGIALSDPEGVLEYAPDHPLADEDGYVRAPSMDMASQMSQLVMAQRGYQASVQVTKYAQDSYSSALQIGQ